MPDPSHLDADQRAYEAALRASLESARIRLATAEATYTAARNRLRAFLEGASRVSFVAKEGKK